ncbi:hypothetical protein BDQ12DRAFT_696496 [Crucibulum laeve]|uniref:RING-type domain-containing protein n=1 Tax=Crucibulum laeve TaxID=68775 RepID=A0A5C3MBY3_9AGAR|nr:hypothetical protein BDQ12DRAFT_696496 [Crucibulum laeve]
MTSTASQPNTPKRVTKMASNQAMNLNHLLNFTLPPRQTRSMASIPRRSRRTGTVQGVWNKERFVNAQYRFVMNPTGDYTVHFADPDIFFQWHDILQVIIPRSSALASAAASGEQFGLQEGHTTCPICLSPPTAPRMTKCGHVYCFPCILHYLSTSDNKWARCPICFDSVNERQLKSVKWFDRPVHLEDDQEGTSAEASSSSSTIGKTFEAFPRAGSSLRMRLIQRPQITTLALPRSHTWPSDLLPPHQAPFHFIPDVFSFAKFMLATPTYLISDLTKDLDELSSERRLLSGMNDDLGVSFIDGAEQKVRNQIAKAAALETPVLREQVEKAYRDQREIEERFAFHARRKQDEAAQTPASEVPQEFLALKSGSIMNTPAPATPIPAKQATPKVIGSQGRNTPRQRRNLNPPPPSTSTYYYYQAASGLPLFLHPLDIKILLSHFNGYASFPDRITVRVESFAEGTVNDDLRKRCKYLAHMPEGADVVFVEADLEDVVGADGLKSFEGPLKMRTSRRKEKGRKDDRAKARAEDRERERERSAVGWTEPVSIPSHYDVPEYPVEDLSAFGEEPVAQPQASPPVVPGAWGVRSFASALHSSPSTRPASGLNRGARQREIEDEWDMDVAFHELEQRNGGAGGGGGRKKKGTRLVVLGGGGGGARRR